MNKAEAEQFIRRQRQAVLATIKKDGRPQLSNVLAAYQDGHLLISTRETSAKYRNLVRDPRATVLLLGDTFWQYLVINGEATFLHLPEAHAPLRTYFELASGKAHPNWEEYDRSMVEERRVLVSISVDSYYPMSG